jgi:hypothetical protein
MSGCGGGGLESTLTGTVTLDGKPIGPGILVFAPTEGAQNPAIGNVEADGRYSVKTSRTSGLKPGRYRVSVNITELPPPGSENQRLAALPLLHPKKYESAETSGLEYDVAPGSNEINVELSSK